SWAVPALCGAQARPGSFPVRRSAQRTPAHRPPPPHADGSRVPSPARTAARPDWSCSQRIPRASSIPIACCLLYIAYYVIYRKSTTQRGLTMSFKSTPDRYGAVSIAFHWLTAILIVALLALGLNAANAPTDEMRRTLLMPHIALGILTLVLTLARIVWW